ncbi:MAG: hypothetical protein AB7N91_11000 [Candidatus Tectimicrobiota bacterium]
MLAGSKRPSQASRRLFRRVHQPGRLAPGWRLSALGTLLAFCTLLVLAGPHLVHHATERSAPEAHHTHADQTAHEVPTAPPETSSGPHCQVLFLVQHTPLVATGVVVLPFALQALAPLFMPSQPWLTLSLAARHRVRAPPAHLL